MALDIALHRLHNQQLVGTKLQTPAEVVGWQGAVQAQEYALAKWALGLRLQGFSDSDVEQAFTDGSILRTHVMRPTWHFVTPDDIRWMLELTAPRVNAVSAYMYRQLDLDNALFVRSNDAIARALEGGKQLTRVELGAVLAQADIQAEGMRLGYIVHRAELDAIVCSGARRGKQFTYALLDERAPGAKKLSREEALVELVLRFFTSHGPAMVHDFSWWSGLTIADTRAGLQMVGKQLVETMIDGHSYWHTPSSAPAILSSSPAVHLMPPYDEYSIAYKHHSAILSPLGMEHLKVDSRTFTAFYGINGQLEGMWKRTFSKGKVIISTRPFRALSAAEHEAFATAAGHFGEFLGMPIEIH